MSFRLKHLRKRKKPGMRIKFISRKLICKPFNTREPLPSSLYLGG
nr:MAG TPA_asm: hypothetical protein [Caudoviricetes sp.]